MRRSSPLSSKSTYEMQSSVPAASSPCETKDTSLVAPQDMRTLGSQLWLKQLAKPGSSAETVAPCEKARRQEPRCTQQPAVASERQEEPAGRFARPAVKGAEQRRVLAFRPRRDLHYFQRKLRVAQLQRRPRVWQRPCRLDLCEKLASRLAIRSGINDSPARATGAAVEIGALTWCHHDVRMQSHRCSSKASHLTGQGIQALAARPLPLSTAAIGWVENTVSP